ncbi:S-adenosyl-L-methionine-dependent methyltransferase [Staphylotrichum tortipilum]|uniref:S-adenosyl-L-methionine-dependent methyltransferase n=1 Tax=Staphylotrichum tortipilum TaxID=2831512 RepID=A0AAN6M951_9PEZI|nr:S-adenosyl-L-methionine-dependent methyltransferase [Staphylotrichum longicolle]
MATQAQPFKGHLRPDGTPDLIKIYPENGRWYGKFKEGQYPFPVDEPELERLDVLHKVYLVARRGALHSSPLPNDHPRVLDLGCGTGIWGIEVADKYPLGVHMGVDLTSVQPEYIPLKMKFLQWDIEDAWEDDREPSTWDLIHLRALNGSIRDWPKLYAQIFRRLQPESGYIEQVEIDYTPRCEDGSLPPDGHMARWAREVFQATDRIQRPLRLDSNLTKQQLAAAGFVDVKEEIIQLPVNGWPRDPHGRDLGRWFNLGLRLSLEPLMLAPLNRTCGRTSEDVRDLAQKARDEVYSNNVHAYCTLHVFTARRPR